MYYISHSDTFLAMSLYGTAYRRFEMLKEATEDQDLIAASKKFTK